MSLHGTLETFALPDVLALLAATKKNGELHVAGGTTDGRVWFDGGNVVGADVGASVGLVDAVFELLRLETGKFSFDADREAPAPGEPAPIQPLLDEAQSRLAEWRSIEAVVPSVAHGVRLLPEVNEGPVTVTGEQWKALVGVATSPTVQSVIERLGVGEFETCRTLKGLVEAGLVGVEERAAASPPPAPAAAPASSAAAAPAATAPERPSTVEAPKGDADAAPERPSTVEAPKGDAVEAPAKPRIQALTSTPAAPSQEAEAAPVSPKAKKPERTSAPVPEPVAQGEADELVRQVAALESAPEAQAAPEAQDTPTPEAPAAEGEEPINRGLLLKFLSSVRT